MPLPGMDPTMEAFGQTTIVYHADTPTKSGLELAREAVQKQMSNAGGGAVVSGILFKQGERPMLMGTLAFNFVSSILTSDSASGIATTEEVQDKSNRPKDDNHTKAIIAYLKETVPSGMFILPSLTANVMAKTRIHTFAVEGDEQPPSRYAYMYLPLQSVLRITDGQHRQSAIKQLLDEMKNDAATVEQLNRSSIPVMITLTADIKQIHQDFADCSKGREMPKSLLAVYHPANGLVMDLVENCGIFKGKTDSTNLKLGKKSPGLFLANMIRQSIKTFLTGGYGISEDDFEVRAKELFGNSNTDAYRDASTFMVAYLNQVTEAIPKLKEYAELTPEQVQARFLELRNAGWLFFTATGLAIIARIGWAIRRDGVEGWEAAIDRMGDPSVIDWHRGTNSDWEQLGVATATRVSTGHRSVIVGAEYVARRIGLDLPSLELSENKGQENETEDAVNEIETVVLTA
jgi:DGQHR domain-containing protein